MRKKGDFTVNELLSIIIAVVGIALISFGAVKLYGIAKNDEGENARAVLDKIVAAVNDLEEGKGGNVTIQGFKGAENWYLIGWGKNVAMRVKPEKCALGSCLCVCPDGKGNEENTCQIRGICDGVDFEEVNVTSYFDTEFSDVYGGVILRFSDFPCVNLPTTISKLEVVRGENSIEISEEVNKNPGEDFFFSNNNCFDIEEG